MNSEDSNYDETFLGLFMISINLFFLLIALKNFYLTVVIVVKEKYQEYKKTSNDNEIEDKNMVTNPINLDSKNDTDDEKDGQRSSGDFH